MGSGVLLAALVALWFVVLVPMVVTRGDAKVARSGAADSGRTLKRRRTVDPVVHAETERVSIDRGELYSSGELKVDVHAIRRRALGCLVALAALAAVGAVVLTPWLWVAQVLVDVATVGYVLVLRKIARRERLAARRAARAAVREARLASVAQDVPVARRAPVAEAMASAPLHPTVAQHLLEPHPSLPLAPVHDLRPGRVVPAREAAPAGWQHSAVVGLDDDDIGFADIDEYAPQRVVNG
jgi:hypothetical protein